MNRALVLIFGICLGVPVTCLAQTPSPTQAQAREFSDFICPRSQEIGQSGKNLTQMGAGLNRVEGLARNFSQGDDEHIISIASHDGLLAYVMTDEACDMPSIYSLMTSAADRQIVRQMMVLRLRELVKSFDQIIEGLNSNLPLLKSPAAVSEVGKLRDLLQVVRDRANKFTPRLLTEH